MIHEQLVSVFTLMKHSIGTSKKPIKSYYLYNDAFIFFVITTTHVRQYIIT